MDQARGYEPAKGDRADLVWGGLSANSADPGAYLQQLAFLTPRYSGAIRRIAALGHQRASERPPRWREPSSETRCSPSTARARSPSWPRAGSAASSTSPNTRAPTWRRSV